MAFSYDSLLIMVLSCVSGLLAEGLCWLFIYRTTSYRRLEAEMDRASRKLEVAKSTPNTGVKKQKKGQRVEELMKASKGEVFKVQMKTSLVTGFALIVFFNLLTQLFDGIPVAKLPFEPPQFIRRVSHRNLQGDDFSDCSVAFIYMLCSTSIRNNLTKLLGLGPSKLIKQQKMFDPAAAAKQS
ncbi:hypothetical protein BSKO_08298 [Bryopsis sp. KO-2023]|nr:hypothetical protein BSKO_08298 [Bryopsis sp. KO-2023]